MKRRAKGMGSITYLGKGRSKPFLACLKRKSYGTYKTMEECEKALLAVILEAENVYPEYINDKIKTDYVDFIYTLQQQKVLPPSVYDFPKMDLMYEMFKTKLLQNGYIFNPTNGEEILNVMTFEELWNEFFEETAPTKSKQWGRSMSAALKKFSNIKNKPINQISIEDIQNCYNNVMYSEKGVSHSTLTNMTIVLRYVYRLSEKKKFTTKNDNPLEYIDSRATGKKRNNRKVFTNEEIKIIMNYNSDIAKIVTLYIFTGMRPIELISMKRSNIHLDKKYMVGGVKTEAGKSRIIPLHDRIIPIIHYFLNQNHTYLFTDQGNLSEYNKYAKSYKKLMSELNLNHVEPYDTRYTFSTIAKTSGVDSSIRKKIMGHSCEDLTDDVYTHEPLPYFLKEINKIKIC